MKRKATLGVLTVVVAAAIILAASVFGQTGAVTPKSDSCPMHGGAADQPCPFTPVVDAAQQMLGPGTGGACPKMEGLKKALGLTPEQDRKITAAYKSFMTEEAPVFSELKAKRIEFHKMVITGEPSKAQVAAKVDEITSLQSRLMLDAAERFIEVKSILTPAQQKTLAEKAGQLGPMCMMGKCGMNGGCDTAGAHKTMGGAPPMVPGAGMKTGARPTEVTDPICGMSISMRDAAAKSQYKGITYYFCNTGCKAKFDKNPGQYAK